MKIDQSLRELRGVPGLAPGRRPTTADLKLVKFYSEVTWENPAVGRADVGGWVGGEAFVRRLARATSLFDLEVELKDAELFGAHLSRKTRDRAARVARVRLAELQGEVLGEGEVR